MIKPWWRFSLCFQNDSSRCHFFTLYTILLLKASTCLFLLLQPAFKKKKKKSREQIVKHSREKRFGKSSYFKNVLSKTLIRLSPYSLFSFCLKIFFRVQLIYNVVLVSGAQQSESAIHIHICTLFQILFPYRPLQTIESRVPSTVPCAIQQVLVDYFIYSNVYMLIPNS